MAEESSLNNSSDEFNEDEGNTVTMVEVLEQEQLLEQCANAVLGGSDDKNCTYNEGYIKRQALYACVTCLPSDKGSSAGVCLACSYHCHEGHDLIELYTKRNFKCDCGNSLFGTKHCTLEPNKTPNNDLNRYNQNFQGLYCTCKRPYPDPEDSIPDEMIQCIVCEDWYHSRHLGVEVPLADSYAEMICGQCSDSLTFLGHYLGFAVTKANSSCNDEEKIKVEVENEEESNIPDTSSNKDSVKEDTAANHVLENGKCIETNEEKPDVKECFLKSSTPLERPTLSATFWPESFRKLLCACVSCQELYKNKGVQFLKDPLDSVLVYEDKGRNKKEAEIPSQYERGLEALSKLDRVKQIEAIQEFNEMKTHLNEYLAKFAQNKKSCEKRRYSRILYRHGSS
uniref:Putative E3 ubiquitin-protein ligase UBR7 n=1 Tax=Clastoptera arizonana TaxID=38151 RepID=A0A1B6CHA3_9HEMI